MVTDMTKQSTHRVEITATESVFVRGLLRAELERISQPGVFVNSGVRERAIAGAEDLLERMTRAYLDK